MEFYTEEKNQHTIQATNNLISTEIRMFKNDSIPGIDAQEKTNYVFYSTLDSAWSNFYDLVNRRPKDLDKNTQFNHTHIERYMDFKSEDYKGNKFVFLSNLLRVLYEYYFFTGNTISRDDNFLSDDTLSLLDEYFGDGNHAPYTQFDWIRDTLPVALMKWLLNSDDFVSARKTIANFDTAKENAIHEISQQSGFAIKDIKSETENCKLFLSETFDDIKSNISQGKNEANETLEYIKFALNEVKALEERVGNLKSEYNFVGLSHGFTKIKEKKEKELLNTEMNYKNLFGTIFIVPVIAVLIHFCLPGLYPKDYSALFMILPFITIEMAIIYFFRLSYLEAKALRTQLIQIELRLSLCSFIDGYVEYRKKNNIAIDKVLESFDSLIFSPIQTNENNIPAMFDGIEAIAGFAEKIIKK